MVISHSLVSWVQVLGLVVGLFGSFYLEIGIFGEKNMPWLGALLPTSAMGLGVLLLSTSNAVSNAFAQLSNAIGQLVYHDHLLHTVPAWYLWVCVVVFLAYVYLFAALLAERHARGDAFSKFWGRFKFYDRVKSLDPVATLYLDRGTTGTFALGAAFWVIVIIGVTTILYFSGEHTSDRLTNALHIGGGITVLLAGQVAMLATAQISDLEQFRKIGFILSALAILTQFMPPLLDLLNISMK